MQAQQKKSKFDLCITSLERCRQQVVEEEKKLIYTNDDQDYESHPFIDEFGNNQQILDQFKFSPQAAARK